MRKSRKVDAGWITQETIQKVKAFGEQLHALARSCGTEDMSISVSDTAVFATFFMRDANGIIRLHYNIDVFEYLDLVEVRGIEWEKEEE